MDAMDLERAHLVGNSMGGRVALETGHDATPTASAAWCCWPRRWRGCASARGRCR